MSLDLFVLAPANAPTFEHAMNVVMGTQPGVADTTGELEGYAQEVYNGYSDEDWPFAGDPIAEDSFVQLVVARSRGPARCRSLSSERTFAAWSPLTRSGVGKANSSP
jgi:hypothetical protein